MCGRFHLDPEQMWEATPGEWCDYLAGAKEADRQMRLGFAGIVATIMGALGSPTDPRALIGEPVEYGDSPFGDETTTAAERQAFRDRELAKIRARAHQAWLPKRLAMELGVVDDDPATEG